MENRSTDFKELFEKYSADVYRFSFWLCGDSSLAKDIASETFVRAWTSEAPIRFETVKAYLLAIARNLYLHEIRRARKKGTLDVEAPDPSPLPDALAGERIELDATVKALGKLPELDRSILLMKAEEGLSYAEISQATGLGVPAIKVKIFRARQRLSALTVIHKGATP